MDEVFFLFKKKIQFSSCEVNKMTNTDNCHNLTGVFCSLLVKCLRPQSVQWLQVPFIKSHHSLQTSHICERQEKSSCGGLTNVCVCVCVISCTIEDVNKMCSIYISQSLIPVIVTEQPWVRWLMVLYTLVQLLLNNNQEVTNRLCFQGFIWSLYSFKVDATSLITGNHFSYHWFSCSTNQNITYICWVRCCLKP